MNRIASQKAIDMIKKFEGCRYEAYKAVASEKYYTIGYGHYGITDANLKITENEALDFLYDDVSQAESAVNKYMDKYNFNQNEFDALVSFSFNVGNINQLTCNGTRSREVIANKMLEYCKSGKKILKGLQLRRKAEHDLFLTPSEYIETYRDLFYGGVFKGIKENFFIRKEPSTTSEKVGNTNQPFDNTVLGIVLTKKDGVWLRVKDGYVHGTAVLWEK